MNYQSLLFLALIALIVLVRLWTVSRSKELIAGWARDHGFEVLDAEERWFRRGPFFWRASNAQTVYYVTVRGPDGASRKAYVRCGGYWGGLWQSRVDVRWEQ